MVGWHHQFNGHESEQLWGIAKAREAWGAAVYGITKSAIQLSNRTTTTSLGTKSLRPRRLPTYSPSSFLKYLPTMFVFGCARSSLQGIFFSCDMSQLLVVTSGI